MTAYISARLCQEARASESVSNKSHGSRYLFKILTLRIQSRNSIVFSPDDINASCSVGDPLVVMRSIIDRDMARLEKSIQALKSRHYPAETSCLLSLAFVLKSCATYFLLLMKTASSGAQSLGPTLVKYHNIGELRSSVLSAPELWTNIPLSHPLWAQEMLKRSKMAKLTIRSGLSLEKLNPKTIVLRHESGRGNRRNRSSEIYLSLHLNFIRCVLEVIRCSAVSKLYFRSMKISSTTQNACNVLS